MPDPKAKVTAKQFRMMLLGIEDWIHGVRYELEALPGKSKIGVIRQSYVDAARSTAEWDEAPKGRAKSHGKTKPPPHKCYPPPGIIPWPPGSAECWAPLMLDRRGPLDSAALEKTLGQIQSQLELCRLVLGKPHPGKPTPRKPTSAKKG